MIVYLLRHGKAEEHSMDKPDRERRLTDEGVASMQEEIPGIKKYVERLDAILTSPYPRASETAAIVAEAYGIEPSLKEIDELAISDAEAALLAQLRKFPQDAVVMLVGHSPLLGELAAFLSGSGQAHAIKKGGLCKISFTGKPKADTGSFDWIFRPKELKDSSS